MHTTDKPQQGCCLKKLQLNHFMNSFSPQSPERSPETRFLLTNVVTAVPQRNDLMSILLI